MALAFDSVGGCCTMGFISFVTSSTKVEMARMMVRQSEVGYNTFLCCVPEGFEITTERWLRELGYRKIVSSPGPIHAHESGHPGGIHGRTMNIWMYSSVEYNTMVRGRMAEKFKEFLKTEEEGQENSVFTIKFDF